VSGTGGDEDPNPKGEVPALPNEVSDLAYGGPDRFGLGFSSWLCRRAGNEEREYEQKGDTLESHRLAPSGAAYYIHYGLVGRSLSGSMRAMTKFAWVWSVVVSLLAAPAYAQNASPPRVEATDLGGGLHMLVGQGGNLALFNVLHTGDLYFNGFFPFMDASSGGSLAGMIAGANKILGLVDEKTQIIPGHGKLSKKSELEAYVSLLTSVQDRIAPMIAAGKTVDDVVAAKPTKEFDAKWGGGFLKPDVWVKIVYAAAKPQSE